MERLYMIHEKKMYQPVARSDSDHSDGVCDRLDEAGLAVPSYLSTRWDLRSKANSSCLAFFNIIVLALSTILFTFSLQKLQATKTGCLKQVSMPSPILDEAAVDLRIKQLPTTFVPLNSSDLFRKGPSYEVDVAWQSLVDSRPVPVSRKTIMDIGKDPAQSVRIPESWGYGSDMYFGRVDVFHQIHCLDALRREVHFDHYYGKKYPNGYNDTSQFHKTHLSHCLHLLLQNIMCNADTDIYTHIWVDSLEHPWPDFQINRQCKSFDAVLKWQKENAVDELAFTKLKRPSGYPYRVTNHEFKEVHGWFDEHSHSVEDIGGLPA